MSGAQVLKNLFTVFPIVPSTDAALTISLSFQSQELELEALSPEPQPASPISPGMVSTMSAQITSPTSAAPISPRLIQQQSSSGGSGSVAVSALRDKIHQTSGLSLSHQQSSAAQPPLPRVRSDTDKTWDGLER